MPSVEENFTMWERDYAWGREGSEWSADWGGARMQWLATLLPRVGAFLPTDTVLEIGPGFGRWSAFLKDLARRLILVDLAPKCIQACQRRFARAEHLTYHVNNGRSLDMIPARSVDLAFSFDTLVHVEEDVLRAYLTGLAQCLKPNGVAFLHHSNLGNCLAARDREDVRTLWRAPSVTAEGVAQQAAALGLQCIGQECVGPATSPECLTDCFTLATRQGSRWSRPNQVWRHLDFHREVEHAARLAQHYLMNANPAG